jgi:hypothetical protein
MKFEDLYSSISEKDEHKNTPSYRKLPPKMRKAVDELFKKIDTKGSNFLNNFEKTVTEVSKKYKVSERKLYDYFEKEAMDIFK